MTDFLIWAALLICASLLLGLVRVIAGPATGDRMLGVQLVGTTGVGLLLLLAVALQQWALLDVALVLALLAAVAAAAFTGRQLEGEDD